VSKMKYMKNYKRKRVMTKMKYIKKCNKCNGLKEYIMHVNGFAQYLCLDCEDVSYGDNSELVSRNHIEHENDMF